jgi:hypothetical protein
VGLERYIGTQIDSSYPCKSSDFTSLDGKALFFPRWHSWGRVGGPPPHHNRPGRPSRVHISLSTPLSLSISRAIFCCNSKLYISYSLPIHRLLGFHYPSWPDAACCAPSHSEQIVVDTESHLFFLPHDINYFLFLWASAASFLTPLVCSAPSNVGNDSLLPQCHTPG